jgi:SAM-dependent methyltransferase
VRQDDPTPILLVPDPGAPNSDQIQYWNGAPGEAWRRRHELLERQLGDVGRLAMDAAAVAPGERVLDVGCGCGSTSLELARRVGSGGSVTGIDVSGHLIVEARTRATQSGLEPVGFLLADAQTVDLAVESIDLVYSRFGVMFFEHPAAAFANLRRSVRPGGRVAFVCWQGLERNPWMAAPLGAAARHLTLPAPPPPGAPGPFAFADPNRVRGILQDAGFDHVDLGDWSGPLSLAGGKLSDAVELLFEIGPLGRILRETGAGPETRERLEETLRDLLLQYDTPEGLRMPAACWIVTARNPLAAA